MKFSLPSKYEGLRRITRCMCRIHHDLESYPGPQFQRAIPKYLRDRNDRRLTTDANVSIDIRIFSKQNHPTRSLGCRMYGTNGAMGAFEYFQLLRLLHCYCHSKCGRVYCLSNGWTDLSSPHSALEHDHGNSACSFAHQNEKRARN